MSNLFIAVVVPTYNRKEQLRFTLLNLKKSKLENVLLLIIVVIDGSTDGTLEMLNDEFKEVCIVSGTGQWWFTKSLNQGIKKACEQKVDAILTLNDDVGFENDYIQKMVTAWLAKGKKSIIGSLSVSAEKPHKITYSGVAEFTKWNVKQISAISFHTPYDEKKYYGLVPTISLVTRGMITSPAVFKALNFLDERMIQYGSDEDFGLRAHKAGYKLFMNYDALIYENEKLTGKGNPRIEKSIIQFTRQFFNLYSKISIKKTILMIWKHGYKLLLPLTLLYIIAGSYKSFFVNKKAI